MPNDAQVTVVLFEVPPPADLRCVICWELFRDPVITPCGHSFCRACVDTELNSSGRCPICRRPTNPFQVHLPPLPPFAPIAPPSGASQPDSSEVARRPPE
eukprot:1195964-Prorocentrum_minimum.AAC.2